MDLNRLDDIRYLLEGGIFCKINQTVFLVALMEWVNGPKNIYIFRIEGNTMCILLFNLPTVIKNWKFISAAELGTIQVLRHHVFDFFRPTHPPL